MASGRDEVLGAIVEHLGPTRAGRQFGIDRVGSLADYRESVPILDRDRHQREIEEMVGFGISDVRDDLLARSASERDQVVAAWRLRIGAPAPAGRVAWVRGDQSQADAAVLTDDLRALAGDVLLLPADLGARELGERLRALQPDVLVVRSALWLGWFERQLRDRLPRLLPQLRIALCEHDIDRVHTPNIELAALGWLERGVRAALPSPGAPTASVTLALGTALVELLPYSNPEDDGRRVYAEQTVLPEDSRVGHRYEVVLSSALGLVRMRTEQHVRVVGFDPPTASAPLPRPRVVRLSTPPADVALEGCTVAGAWLTAAVRQALGPGDPALVAAEIGADPLAASRGRRRHSSIRAGEAFAETELGATTTRTNIARAEINRRPRGLLCRIELQGLVRRDLPGRLSARIDESVRRRSPAYAWLREKEELGPPQVIVVPPGTRAADRERRIAGLSGEVWAPDVRISRAT